MTNRAATALFILWVAALALILAPLALGLGGSTQIEGPGLDGGRILELAGNSILMSLGAVALALVLAVPIGLTTARLMPPKRALLLLTFAMAPLFIPPPVVAIACARLFGPAGLLTDLITGGQPSFAVSARAPAGAPKVPGAPIYSIPGGSFSLAIALFPLAVLAIHAALRRANPEAESAALLEARPGRVLRAVTLPLAAGGIAAGASLVFLFAITEFGVPETLRSLPVLVSEIYVQFGVYYDTRSALMAALTIVGLGAGGFALAAVILRATGLGDIDHGDSSNADATRLPGLLSLKAAGWVLGIVPAVGIVAVLIATATGPQGHLAVWRDTLKTAHEELLFTLGLGVGMAILTAAVGAVLGAALWTRRRPIGWRLLVAAPLIMPGPVLGIGASILLHRPPGSLPLRLDDALASLAGTLVPLMAIWVLRYAPVVALIVEGLLRSMPAAWTEQTRLDGASFFEWWGSVAWPVCWPGVIGGMLAALALSLGEVGAAVLLLPPGPTTLGVRLATLMHYAPTGQVSALSVMTLLPGLLAYAGAVGIVVAAKGKQADKVH